MILEIGTYTLDIDIEKNKLFYKNAAQITDGCSCDGCCNYMIATEIFPKEVKDFFDNLGIDSKKAAEIITWCSENNAKSMFYGGFYHLCGELLSGNNCWKDSGEMNEDELYSIVEGYSVGFSSEVSLPEDNFPFPIIQMEINFHNVPWLLKKENHYRQRYNNQF